MTDVRCREIISYLVQHKLSDKIHYSVTDNTINDISVKLKIKTAQVSDSTRDRFWK